MNAVIMAVRQLLSLVRHELQHGGLVAGWQAALLLSVAPASGCEAPKRSCLCRLLLVRQGQRPNELVVKKLSMLGCVALVLAHSVKDIQDKLRGYHAGPPCTASLGSPMSKSCQQSGDMRSLELLKAPATVMQAQLGIWVCKAWASSH